MSQNQMNDSDNPLGKSITNDNGHENYGNELNEPIALKAKVQVLETENKQLVEANKQLAEEKKIQEEKCSKLEKEMREKSLKRKLRESEEELAEKKFRSLEENYLKEIAELKLKNQKLTEEFGEKIKKLEERIQMNEQKVDEAETEIMVQIRQMKMELSILETIQRVLTKIAPIITSFESITSTDYDLFNLIYAEDGCLLLMEILAKTRIISTKWNWCPNDNPEWEDRMDRCCSWLYSPRDDGEPRMLRSDREFYLDTDCPSFIERIKKDFEMANDPVSFFIYTKIGQDDNVEDISVENTKTNEKLVVKNSRHLLWRKNLLISRYPLNAAKSWIEANEKEISKWNGWNLNRQIKINDKRTIAM